MDVYLEMTDDFVCVWSEKDGGERGKRELTKAVESAIGVKRRTVSKRRRSSLWKERRRS